MTPLPDLLLDISAALSAPRGYDMMKLMNKILPQTSFRSCSRGIRFNFQLEGEGIRSKPGGLGLAWICAMIFGQTMPARPGSFVDNEGLYLVTHLLVPDPTMASPTTTRRSPTTFRARER